MPSRRAIGSLGGGMNGAFYPETYVAASLLSTLTTLGLTTNLKLCLDAGEGDSYTSGQKWLDLSGNGEDFFLGADGNATATDPTFNGVADTLSSAEFFSFDGGDYFRYDTTNPTWVNNLHKAGQSATFLAVVNPGAGGVNSLFGTAGASNSDIGVSFYCNPSTGRLAMSVRNGTGTLGVDINSTAVGVTSGAFQVLALSYTEGGSYVISRNAVTATGTITVTTPSASAATYTAEVGSQGNANTPMRSGGQMAMFAAWEGVALTAWQIEQIYNKVRRRFGV